MSAKWWVGSSNKAINRYFRKPAFLRHLDNHVDIWFNWTGLDSFRSFCCLLFFRTELALPPTWSAFFFYLLFLQNSYSWMAAVQRQLSSFLLNSHVRAWLLRFARPPTWTAFLFFPTCPPSKEVIQECYAHKPTSRDLILYIILLYLNGAIICWAIL